MFDLKEYIEKRGRIIDSVLDKVMPEAACRPPVLHRAMRYAVFPGGKRIRPILCLASAEATGSSYRKAIFPAAAIELLHTYTLVHDDLPCMDNDDFRRGRPTIHRKFGEANAVLAGDALQTLAFEVISRAPAMPFPARISLVYELAQAAGSTGVVGGQCEDLAAAGKKQTPARIEFIHRRKTADLFRASLRIGALSGGADRKQLAALTTYGSKLGLAFQITDDLLDKHPAAEGVASDRPELTCLSVLNPERALRKAKRLISGAISALRGLKSGVEPLIYIARFVVDRTC